MARIPLEPASAAVEALAGRSVPHASRGAVLGRRAHAVAELGRARRAGAHARQRAAGRRLLRPRRGGRADRHRARGGRHGADAADHGIVHRRGGGRRLPRLLRAAGRERRDQRMRHVAHGPSGARLHPGRRARIPAGARRADRARAPLPHLARRHEPLRGHACALHGSVPAGTRFQAVLRRRVEPAYRLGDRTVRERARRRRLRPTHGRSRDHATLRACRSRTRLPRAYPRHRRCGHPCGARHLRRGAREIRTAAGGAAKLPGAPGELPARGYEATGRSAGGGRRAASSHDAGSRRPRARPGARTRSVHVALPHAAGRQHGAGVRHGLARGRCELDGRAVQRGNAAGPGHPRADRRMAARRAHRHGRSSARLHAGQCCVGRT